MTIYGGVVPLHKPREGYVFIEGIEPKPGERVLLSPLAGAQFFDVSWYQVTHAELAWVPGNIILFGHYFDTYGTPKQPTREYVRIKGLKVECSLQNLR